MNKERIARINALAKKKRESGLTPEEAAEQQALREAYLADFRRTLEGQLDSILLVDEQGNRTPLPKKQPPKA